MQTPSNSRPPTDAGRETVSRRRAFGVAATLLLVGVVIVSLPSATPTAPLPSARPTAPLPSATPTDPLPSATRTAPPEIAYDVVVYGGTASGVMAAISAAQSSMRTALVEPGWHLGGMLSSGLSVTDVGDPAAIGGLTAAFFSRVRDHYRIPSLAWRFEPHVAEAEFERELKQAGVTVYLGQRLRQHGGVDKTGTTVTRLVTESGLVLAARAFIDSSYEGDLLAQAGVAFVIGRESSGKYGESLGGFVGSIADHLPIDGLDPAGSALPGIGAIPVASPGSSDAKVGAYTFRLCVTQRRDGLIPFPQPAGYRPDDFELLGRYIEMREQRDGLSPGFGDLVSLVELPNGKFDLNNRGMVSTDMVGGNWDYPSATYKDRERIWEAHRAYEQGFLYFLGHDRSVPQALRSEMATWGLCRDEFVDTGGWPPQLYVREARRMVGEAVLTQANVQDGATGTQTVALGSYPIDSHHVQRYVDAAGRLVAEGHIWSPTIPYGIPYGVLVPREAEASNLLVSVAVSASHVAFSSVRMEPQFMMMGEAAGTAAALAVSGGTSVQHVDVPALRAMLLARGAVLKP